MRWTDYVGLRPYHRRRGSWGLSPGQPWSAGKGLRPQGPRERSFHGEGTIYPEPDDMENGSSGPPTGHPTTDEAAREPPKPVMVQRLLEAERERGQEADGWYPRWWK